MKKKRKKQRNFYLKYFNIKECPISLRHFQIVSSQHEFPDQSSSNAKNQHYQKNKWHINKK